MANTKSRMIEAATRILLEKGVHATSVDDILKATRTGKSQFYHYFGSKSGMVTQVLEYLREELQTSRWGTHLLPNIDGWDKIAPWLKAVADTGIAHHPVAMLALSMPAEERDMQPSLHQLYDELRMPLLAFLLSEQQAGRFLAAVNCEELADLALTGIIGATIKTSMGSASSASPVDRTAHHLYLYLKAYARA